MHRSPLFVLTLLLVISLALLPACGTTYPHRDPTGEPFPTVTGTSLAGEPVDLPADFAGAPAVLLIGYDQDAQFDADRWLLGLLQAEPDVAIREVPTIPGFAPRVFSGSIDSGMRGGIPEEEWGTVITVYGDGDTIAEFTGNEDGGNMRAILLDAEGRVAFFHDRGYSAATLIRMLDRLAELTAAPTPR